MQQRISPLQRPGRPLRTAEPSPAVFHSLVDDAIADITLGYAALCTTDPEAARTLVHAATARMNASEQSGARSSVAGLPAVPRLLRSLHDTAASLRSLPERASLLTPEYATWLDDRCARREPPPLHLQSLYDLSALEAELLWWNKVEALSADLLATALGWEAEYTARVLEQVGVIFVERCRARHMENARRQRTCRSYGGMLEASMRRGDPELPPELREHLDVCAMCGELWECLNAAREGTLGDLIASAALGWRGSAYVAARRDSAHAASRPVSPHRATRAAGARVPRRRAVPRSIAAVAAVGAVGVLVAAVTVVAAQRSPAGGGTEVQAETASVQPPVGPERTRTGTAGPTTVPSRSSAPKKGHRTSPAPKVRPTEPKPHNTVIQPPPRKVQSNPPPLCTSRLKVDDDWGTGASVELTVQSRAALSDWQVSFDIAAGTTLKEAWNGTSTAEGSRVTVTAADYDRAVSAGGSLTIGMVYDGPTSDNWIRNVTLNKATCASA
ncbi:cellulose binding domain-containing protein [Streptomyces griseofuscus]|uniref:cellulose binding domain-containing protein n=1 Tax=Streptomyces griseofuscus TaxID=146922 RepID=UPI0036C62F0D